MNTIPGLSLPDLSNLGIALVALIVIVAAAVILLSFVGSHR